MATLLLAAAGGAIGGAIGGTVLGVSAAAIGQAAGAYVGSVIDAALMPGPGTTRREGPRLDSLQVTTSQAGAPLPDIWGRTATGGQIIWAARLREVIDTDVQRVGSGKKKGKVETTTYSYRASFALSLGEGPLSGYGRIWADGRILDLVAMRAEGRLRFYSGTDAQAPDPLIAATEGAAPAFRGTAYLVFEDLPLDEYGNRIPQIRVEVFGARGDLEPLIRGVNLIPASTEWGYDPEVARVVERAPGGGAFIESFRDNAHRYPDSTDLVESLGHLDQVLPNADTVSLVVAWFGTDLRAGACNIEPRIEFRNRSTDPVYEAGGRNRLTVTEVSRDAAGRPAYGSTPADASVIRCIRHLKARGKRVVLYPFIMMDVTAAQALPDPSGAGTQPDYPWRGRIMPTAGQPVAAEVAAFMGTATAAQFTATPGADSVGYSGPDDGGFRRFILWMAALAKAAGGVDAFLIGTEMRGMSFGTDGGGVYPFVDGLVDLAAEVRALLPGAALSYAADWSEYHSHRTDAGVFFHLDPLWASPAIDFVGIDNYLPLSDWRPGTDHADYNPAGPTSPYDLAYLKGQIEGGEYWDYFYADDAARAAQDRSPIDPDAFGETWVFRQKAVRDWHGNAHHNRPGFVRSATPTAWSPGSKPVWFTEIGCPAVTFGANQPNVFSARLSSESALPYFSDGARDDFMQRQYLRASLEWWRDNGAGVLDIANAQVWCWDARPFPEFPTATGLWVDGDDWALGHWLNGRAGAAPLAEIARARIARHGLSAADLDLSRAWGQADGYAIPGPTSWRDVVQPFEVAAAASLVEDGGRFVVESRAAPLRAAPVSEDMLVDTGAPSPWSLLRRALEDAPQVALLRFRDGLGDYHVAESRASIGAGLERGIAQAESPLILDPDRAAQAAERMLREGRAGVESGVFALPRSFANLRPGMVLPLSLGGIDRLFMVERITDAQALEIEVRTFDGAAFDAPAGIALTPAPLPVFGSDAVVLVALDLPLLFTRPEVAAWDGYLAAHSRPWPAGVNVIRATAPAGAGPAVGLEAPATMGETVGPLAAGRPWTFDPAASVDVLMYGGAPVSATRAQVAAGANVAAVDHGGGQWEILQYARVDLVGPNTWRLSDLVRGARGTEWLAAAPLPAGARVVFLSGAVEAAGIPAEDVGRPLVLRYGPAGSDPVTYAEAAHTFRGVGRRPYAPAHLTAAPVGGDYAVTWSRRARSPAGFTLSTGPALDQAAEVYRVEVGPAGAPVRVETVTAPAWTYTAAMQSADGIAAPFALRVAQVSDTWGPGPVASLEIPA